MKLGHTIARLGTAVLEWCAERLAVTISLEGLEFGEADVAPALLARGPDAGSSGDVRSQASAGLRSATRGSSHPTDRLREQGGTPAESGEAAWARAAIS